MTGEESRQKYDATHPRVTVRLTTEMKAKLQQEAREMNKTVSEVILERIVSRASAASRQVSADIVRDNVLFMLEFFQDNAANLDITESQRERFVKIYEWVQTL
ncbi:MAG: ribbon-helix-helix protein, CopG family [Candidatus Sigynarchaeota archaeon]